MAHHVPVRDVNYYEASNTAECLRALRRAKKMEPQQVVDAVNGSHDLLGSKPVDLPTYTAWENGTSVPASYHVVLKSVLAPDKGTRDAFERQFGAGKFASAVSTNDPRAGGHSVFADQRIPLIERVAAGVEADGSRNR